MGNIYEGQNVKVLRDGKSLKGTVESIYEDIELAIVRVSDAICVKAYFKDIYKDESEGSGESIYITKGEFVDLVYSKIDTDSLLGDNVNLVSESMKVLVGLFARYAVHNITESVFEDRVATDISKKELHRIISECTKPDVIKDVVSEEDLMNMTVGQIMVCSTASCEAILKVIGDLF